MDTDVWIPDGGNILDGCLLDGSSIRLHQHTSYPWDEEIKLEMEEATEHKFALMLRVPTWTNGAQVTVNGEPIDSVPKPGEYACVERKWSPGDTVTLILPMPPRLMEAHPLIEADQNRVAVMRGPLLYCLESVDLSKGVKLSEVRIPRDIELTPRHDPDLLSGVTVLEGSALRIDLKGWSGRLYRSLSQPVYETIPIRLIPYYASANRGVAEMSVWLPLA